TDCAGDEEDRANGSQGNAQHVDRDAEAVAGDTHSEFSSPAPATSSRTYATTVTAASDAKTRPTCRNSGAPSPSAISSKIATAVVPSNCAETSRSSASGPSTSRLNPATTFASSTAAIAK